MRGKTPSLAALMLAALCCVGLARGAVPTQTGAAGIPGEQIRESLLLVVVINENEQTDVARVVRLADGALAVGQEALTNWNFQIPARPDFEAEGQSWYRLARFEGLQWQIQTRTQALQMQAPSALFVRNEIAWREAPLPLVDRPSTGGFLNYDLQVDRMGQAGGAGSAGGTTQTLGGLFEMVGFGAWGTASTTVLHRRGDAMAQTTRLDSQLTLDFPQRKASLRLGDAIGQSGAWGRATRFGGLQWASDFSITPGFSTFPTPALRGEAALPSTLDLYVNNTARLNSNLPPGPFDLSNVPLVTGQGEVRMTVRDLLGREQTIVQPYYIGRSLLKPGLRDFSWELGSVREDYGLASAHYGRAFLAATDRVGVTPGFTRELRAEILKSQQTVGAAGSWLVSMLGTASVFGALSRSDRNAQNARGWTAGLNFNRQAQNFSGSVQWSHASEDFAQLGQGSNLFTSRPRTSLSMNAGLPLGGGSLGASLLQQSTWQSSATRILSASYSHGLGKSAYLSAALSRQSGSASGSLFSLTLTFMLDARTSLSLAGMGEGGQGSGQTRGAMHLQRNAPVGNGLGVQLHAEGGMQDRTSAQANWQTDHASFSAGAAHSAGADALRAGVSGGVALLGGDFYASRRIEDSFAVVRVGDYADVQVLRDNQPVARTDGHGRAFISGLRGYERNRISIEQADLPLDARITQLEMLLAPPRRSGIAVEFPVQREESATARLKTPDGKPLPLGSSMVLAGQGKRVPVGYDGRVFLSGVKDWSQLVLESAEHRCALGKRPSAGVQGVADLGDISCVRQAQ